MEPEPVSVLVQARMHACRKTKAYLHRQKAGKKSHQVQLLGLTANHTAAHCAVRHQHMPPNQLSLASTRASWPAVLMQQKPCLGNAA